MIYIVLPAYNEEKTLPPLLSAIKRSLEDDPLEYHVIVVNDGSSDGTVAAVRACEGLLPITLLEHERNKGLSEAIKTGLMEATRRAGDDDIIVSMDSDNTHTPGLVLRLVRMIREGHDVVIASRYQRGARVKGVPFARRVLSYGASLLFRVLFPIEGVKDYTCGYRAYRASVIKRMFEEYGDHFIDEPGFSCMVDILLKMRRYDFIIGEAPLILRYDLKAGMSKMNVKKTVLETLSLVLRRKTGRV